MKIVTEEKNPTKRSFILLFEGAATMSQILEMITTTVGEPVKLICSRDENRLKVYVKFKTGEEYKKGSKIF